MINHDLEGGQRGRRGRAGTGIGFGRIWSSWQGASGMRITGFCTQVGGSANLSLRQGVNDYHDW